MASPCMRLLNALATVSEVISAHTEPFPRGPFTLNFTLSQTYIYRRHPIQFKSDMRRRADPGAARIQRKLRHSVPQNPRTCENYFRTAQHCTALLYQTTNLVPSWFAIGTVTCSKQVSRFTVSEDCEVAFDEVDGLSPHSEHFQPTSTWCASYHLRP